MTNNAWRHLGPGFTVPVDDAAEAFTPNSQPEMFSQLVHRTNAVFRAAHPFIPSSLGALQCSHMFRAYSWSTHSQTANWSHLNDIYSKAVDVKSKERPSTPDERWAMQSRSRMANLKPPKGPYAGTTFFLPPSNLKAF